MSKKIPVIETPWTEEQVEIMQRYQDNLNVHPYTCTCRESLVPTVTGWECEVCPYTQNYFLEGSLDLADYKGLWEEHYNPSK